MTPVLFTFTFPDGSPVANTEFKVSLRKSAFSADHEGIIHPDVIVGVTDADGKCTLLLEPADISYYMSMDLNGLAESNEECPRLRYRFKVPQSSNVQDIKDLIITDPTFSRPWDEVALEKLQEAVNDAQEAEIGAVQAKDASVAAKDAAVLAMEGAQTAEYNSGISAAASQTSNVESYTNSVNAGNYAAIAKQEADRAAAATLKGSLPVLTGENASYINEGDTTYGWDAYFNSSIATDGSNLVFTKGPTVANSGGARYAFTDPGLTGDLIVYFRVKTAEMGVVGLQDTDFSSIALWFGTPDSGVTAAPGKVTLSTYDGATATSNYRDLGGTYAYGDFITLALHLDVKWGQVNAWILNTNTSTWVLAARLPYVRRKWQYLWLAGAGNMVAGSKLQVDWVQACRPNIVIWGDSIATGALHYDPNPVANITEHENSAAMWSTSARLYPTVRNNLPINKGVGGRTSVVLGEAIETELLPQKPNVVFMHASSNDASNAIAMETRSAYVQMMVDALSRQGAGVVLLNALPGTPAHPTNTSGQMRDYVHAWWANYMPKISGLAMTFDIASVLKGVDGYQDVSLTAPDGIHPTVDGYVKIGEAARSLYSSAAKPLKNYESNPVLSELARQVGVANNLLAWGSATSFASVPLVASTKDWNPGRVLTTGYSGIGSTAVLAGPYLVGAEAGMQVLDPKRGGFYSYYQTGVTGFVAATTIECLWGVDSSWGSQLVMTISDSEIYYRSLRSSPVQQTQLARMVSSANLVGTVGASGFANGGALMEVKVVGTGYYKKYADGTLECQITISGYTANTSVTKAWPHAFLAGSTVSVAGSVTPMSFWDYDTAWYGSEYVGAFISQNDGADNIVILTGFGRWKE